MAKFDCRSKQNNGLVEDDECCIISQLPSQASSMTDQEGLTDSDCQNLFSSIFKPLYKEVKRTASLGELHRIDTPDDASSRVEKWETRCLIDAKGSLSTETEVTLSDISGSPNKEMDNISMPLQTIDSLSEPTPVTSEARVYVEMPQRGIIGARQRSNCASLKKRSVYVELPKDGITHTQHSDDTSSISSASSLLSSLSGATTLDSAYHGLERVEQRFVIRDKQLKQFERRKNRFYMNMLRYNEQAVREQEMARLKTKYKGRRIHIKQIEPTSNIGNQASFIAVHLRLMQNLLLFECHHVVPGMFLVILYTFSSLAFYNCVNAILTFCRTTCSSYISTDAFQALVLFVGLSIIRWTGYVWWWIDDASYAGVKFEIHNRAKLRFLDARLITYFRKTETLFAILNVVSYNLTFIAMVHFYDRISYNILYDYITEWYENIVEQASEVASGSPVHASEVASGSPVHAECDMIKKYTHGITNLLGYYLCHTDEQWYLVQALYDFFMWSTSALILGWLGFNILTEDL